eukprot:3314387-Rhodomonas_salina.1
MPGTLLSYTPMPVLCNARYPPSVSPYAMPSTATASGAVSLCACYGMSGTEKAYGAPGLGGMFIGLPPILAKQVPQTLDPSSRKP